MSGITNYENLANAIILQAVKDYRATLRTLKAKPRNKKALAVKAEAESFFRSQWFTELTSIDGVMLITKLKEEIS